MPDFLHITVLIVHVIGASLIIGMAFTGLLVITVKPFAAENMKVMQRFGRVGPIFFVTQLLSGLYLGFSEFEEFRGNPLLPAKLLLFLGLAGVSMFLIRRAAAKAKEGVPPSPNIAWAWVSFLTMLLIATFGVILTENHG